MTYVIRSTGALAVLWLGTLAAPTALGQNTAQPHPANASAAVPSTRYVPVQMPNVPIAAPIFPANNWKALNKTVAAYDAMSLTRESMEMASANAAVPTPPAMAQPASHTAQPSPTSPAPEAHSHHMHKELK